MGNEKEEMELKHAGTRVGSTKGTLDSGHQFKVTQDNRSTTFQPTSFLKAASQIFEVKSRFAARSLRIGHGSPMNALISS